MVKGHTKNGLPRKSGMFRVGTKNKLGIFLLAFFTFIIFLFNPFVTNSYAQQTDTPEFQLMFPGYLSQHYSKWHKALDIATGLGMPIKPITSGKVTSAGYDFFGYGLKVEIDHGNGYKSLYAHLGNIYVKEGQEIDSNHYIGDVGLTGRTTGPHTHLEVFKNNVYIDPERVLPEIREYATEDDFKPVGGRNSYHPTDDPIHDEKGNIKEKQTVNNALQTLLAERNSEKSKLDKQIDNVVTFK